MENFFPLGILIVSIGLKVQGGFVSLYVCVISRVGSRIFRGGGGGPLQGEECKRGALKQNFMDTNLINI